MKRFYTLLFLLFFAINILPQSYIKVMTWNIHDYTPYNPSPSNPNWLDFDNPALRYVINAIQPDILVCQEVRDQASVDQLMKYVLEYNYKQADYYPTSNTSSALFYKESKFFSLGNIVHAADTRPINEFPLVHKTTNDTLIVFSVHLKANTTQGDNSDNIRRRHEAVKVLRARTEQLPATKNFIIAGDFNTLNASEPGFQALINQSTKGYVYDPLNSIGEWANNPNYAHTHTMYANNLNVRFDMILISQAVKDPGGIEFMDGFYKIVGNDGKRFNQSISSPTNAFGKELADSIISASDHLPVYAIFSFSGPTSVVTKENLPNQFYLSQNYPNPFNPETVINYSIPAASKVMLKVYDLLGNEVALLVNEVQDTGTYSARFTSAGKSLGSGIYFYILRAGALSASGKMMLIK